MKPVSFALSTLVGVIGLMVVAGGYGGWSAQAQQPAGTATHVGTHRGGDSLKVAAPINSASIANGDVDCDGDVDAVDSLGLLQYVAGLSVSLQEPCPDIGVQSHSGFFGDVDCDLDVDAVDAQKILRHVVSLSVNQEPNCSALGDPLPGL